ncbi:MAG: response regulator transcription factor [Propionibacterium sp.]|nr:response regulator transcription factor [Propionibacterium sp.]
MSDTSGCPGSLSVVVIDDHEIVGLGVAQAMAEAGRPVEVRHVHTAALVGPCPGPRVVVLDLRLADGSTPTENLLSMNSMGVPVVIYTSADDPVLVRESIVAGALSIVRKSAPPSELVDAVMEAAEGRTMPGLDWAAALDADEDFVSEHLTQTEAQVLTRYASGETSGVVARQLGISSYTVDTYVARIRDKYRSVGRPADSRIDLFRRAAEDGLVSYYEPGA